MVTSVRVLSPHAVGYMAFDGQLVVLDLLDAVDHVFEHPGWQSGGSLVFDFLAVRSVVLDLHDLEGISAYMDERFAALGAGGTTVFVTVDFVLSGICDLFRTKRRNMPRTLRRVGSLAQAEAVLRLAPGTLTPSPAA